MCEDHGHHFCERHFLTTDEKIEHLQQYKKWLENEAKGVEETITKIKKEAT